MYKFKTVKQLIEELQQLPPDADVHIGNFDGFLDADLKKEAYDLYPLEYVEHKTVYSFRRGAYQPWTCVVLSTG
jgi:hypothetical protein